MASFNLGRIKGDKGDKGDTGAKGDRGEKGEKGETGASGIDGRTPVFTVGETATIAPDEEAHVELDCSDIENPVLSFYIPRGRDGRDALGDMLATVYDAEGKKEDFYKYADNLFKDTLKITGGILTGSLSATEADGKTAVMRNISMRTSLPEEAVEGDICIITPNENSKKLGDCETGNTMLISENGNETEYIIVAKDYHKPNTVTLVRQRLPNLGVYFDYRGREDYLLSDMDMFLEVGYKEKFSEEIKKNLVTVALTTLLSRQCFLLSKEELENIEYFKTAENRAAYSGTSKENYFTRSTVDDRAYLVTSVGSFALTSQKTKKLYRPAIVLPSSLEVENTIKINTDIPAVKMAQTKKGVYAFLGGEWKECASL
ncbi:MAG: hypothetical protein IJD91_05455 [Clostridia bacterium]|nr:hypothetical protein [Clostridia bacterium]